MLRSDVVIQLFKQVHAEPIKSDGIDRVARPDNRGFGSDELTFRLEILCSEIFPNATAEPAVDNLKPTLKLKNDLH